jgi:peptide-methionine (S)-S-oxide reductase
MLGAAGARQTGAAKLDFMKEQNASETKKTATLGGGCFWCLQPLFEGLSGVDAVEVGYSGGSVANPTYQQVCTGTTGHAEVIQVVFSPELISYQEILEIFLTIHDPTTRNRQGADVGTQYRSIIFFHDDEQKQTAERVIRELASLKIWKAPIVTEVVPFQVFYPAEEYHQNYYRDNPEQGYCRAVIEPKVLKFRSKYAAKLQSAGKNSRPGER